jgi:hypothetical protein
VPSHTPLLHEATEQFGPVLREASPRLPRAGYRLLSGIDGDTIYDIDSGIDKLARQISTTINWAACLESCQSAGVQAALELGPGSALSHMASALLPGGRARSVEEFATGAGVRSWLQWTMRDLPLNWLRPAIFIVNSIISAGRPPHSSSCRASCDWKELNPFAHKSDCITGLMESRVEPDCRTVIMEIRLEGRCSNCTSGHSCLIRVQYLRSC